MTQVDERRARTPDHPLGVRIAVGRSWQALLDRTAVARAGFEATKDGP